MKKKGIIVAAFFAVILLASTAAISSNRGPSKQTDAEKTTVTGTPEDNFPDAQRAKFCETGDAKSSEYVTEFKIPTKCTQPLSVVTDGDGMVWFSQTNTGKVAKFDPQSKQFTEFNNPQWPQKGRSMFWGMTYANGDIWYTDDAYNSIWKFSTSDKQYQRVSYPSKEDSLPHHIKVRNDIVIVNDFYGSKISFFDLGNEKQNGTYTDIPSPIPGSFTSSFDFDSQGYIWYTNWILKKGGALVKFDYNKFSHFTVSETNSTLSQLSKAFDLPPTLGTPIGLSVDSNDNVWMADTSSSSFFKFDPQSEKFTRYVTSDVRPAVYGNVTGLIKVPASGPYWTQINNGKLIFNEQLANAIGVMDIGTESLVEYNVPSKNPNWSDCNEKQDCGYSQVFGFTSDGGKIWFTEWVENNIGMIDTTKPLPFDLQLSQTAVSLAKGQSAEIQMQLTSNTNTAASLLQQSTSQFADVTVQIQNAQVDLTQSSPQTIPVSIHASDFALPGTYKVLLSARTPDVTVSQFVTVTITE
ncbi:MAG: lyase [Candidatus Nitrosotenuis sp.]|nr:MAG: lyase [Candidatus Nitrosotenuis sp.]